MIVFPLEAFAAGRLGVPAAISNDDGLLPAAPGTLGNLSGPFIKETDKATVGARLLRSVDITIHRLHDGASCLPYAEQPPEKGHERAPCLTHNASNEPRALGDMMARDTGRVGSI